MCLPGSRPTSSAEQSLAPGGPGPVCTEGRESERCLSGQRRGPRSPSSHLREDNHLVRIILQIRSEQTRTQKTPSMVPGKSHLPRKGRWDGNHVSLPSLPPFLPPVFFPTSCLHSSSPQRARAHCALGCLSGLMRNSETSPKEEASGPAATSLGPAAPAAVGRL